jgi:hypothetical protein
MKIRVTLQDPDTLYDDVESAVRADIKANTSGLSKKEQKAILDERCDEERSVIAERWMPYSEYLTVEFDTEAGTATVVPAKEFK